MNDLTPMHSIYLVPLAELTLSDLNARDALIDGEVEAMADSIAVSGLLQNLIGYRDPEGHIGIVGGGKRLRALQLLASEGWSRVPQDRIIDPVPVKVTADPAKAIAWSGTENTARSDLHPADEVRAYARMRNQGSTLPAIARTFAKSELHVERRLKLADLPEAVLDALRTDRITIDVARALTLAPSQDAAVDALEAASQPRVTAAEVRRMFIGDRIRSDDRRVAIAGLDNYLAAGGRADSDLFEGASYLHDEKLLDRLFKDALLARADDEKVAGAWNWVEIILGTNFDWNVAAKYDRIYREPIALTDADQAEMDAIEARIDAIEATPAEHQRAEELRKRQLGDFTDEDLAHAGVFIWVNWHGEIKTSDPYRRRNDQGTDTASPAINVNASTASPAADMPQNLLDDLARIKLACLQAAAVDKTELLLDLLAFSFSTQVSPYGRPLAVRLDTPNITPDKLDGTEIDARLPISLDIATEPATADTFQAFRTLGKKHRNTALSQTLARHLLLDTRGLSDVLARETGVLIRRTWTPTAAGFFSRCAPTYLDRLWAQLLDLDLDDDQRASFAKLKKANKAKALEDLFNDLSVREAHGLSRVQNAIIDQWVPAELRFGD